MSKNVLITGAAKRIGAACARVLHRQGYNIVIHYRNSQAAAQQLCTELNAQRPASAIAIQADLLDLDAINVLATQASQAWGGIDVLVNNSSTFYPQPFEQVTHNDWHALIDSNLKAPFFLIQALLPSLQQRQGCVVNIIDIHAERGLKDYPVYSIAKAGLAALTKVLAKELAPTVRVNGVSPGAILWPEQATSSQSQAEILQRIALQRAGEPDDIAKAVAFLIQNADYITGQILSVDGGRTLFC